MKKFLSVLLALFVAMAFIGTHSLITVNAEEGDATLYIHIFQFDQDYTNTGVGIYDGVNWNSWADVSTSTDDFGAVIAKTYTAAELAAIGASGDYATNGGIQIKPSRNATVDDSANYLSTATDAQMVLNIDDLIDASETELHVYFVEGDSELMLLNSPKGTVVIYMDPAIAIDTEAYTDWGIHTWNNGAMPDTEWTSPMPFSNTLDVQAGEYSIPMETVIVPLDSDAVGTSGFIVHMGESKADPNDLALDVPTNGPVNIEFYIRGTGTIYTDVETFLADAETEYAAGLVNRIVSANVTDPQTVAVEMFQPKTPGDIAADFWIEDANQAIVAIEGYDFGDLLTFGNYDSAVTVQSQTHVKFYLQLPTGSDVTSPLTDYGLVGDLTGWAPDQTTIAPKEHINDGTEDWLVFEFATYQSTIAFKVLYNDGVDNPATTDTDESGFDWSDAQVASVAGDNVSIDFAGASSVTYRFYSSTEVLILGMLSVPSVSYTYTPVASQTNNLLTIFVPLDETKLASGDSFSLTNLGYVGSSQGWDIGNAIAPTQIIMDGSTQVAVFEIDTEAASGEYKIYYDDDADGFNWAPDDVELVNVNTPFDFGSGTTLIQDFGGAYVALTAYVDTVTVENTFLLTIYMEDNYPDFNVGIVGGMNGWDINNPILPYTTDVFGNLVFDIAVTSRIGEFKIFIDKNEDGFDWGDAVVGAGESEHGGNLSYDFGTANQGVLWFSEGEDNVFVKTVVGENIDGITTKTFSVTVADGTLVDTSKEYTAYFTEIPASEGVEELVIENSLTFVTQNSVVVPADYTDFDATYALNPTTIEVLLENALTSLDNLSIIDDAGNSVAISSVAPKFAIGTYTSTITVAEGEVLVTLYIHTDRDYTSINQFGVVGAVQAWNGTDYTGASWNPSTAILPVGTDSEGNIVFQFVLGETTDAKEFKILFAGEDDAATTEVDESMTFAWGDPEVTPANVSITPSADYSNLFVDGSSTPGNVAYTVTLTSGLSASHSYYTVLVDANGFDVTQPLFVDNTAPAALFTVKPNVDFELTQGDTFDIMNYYTIFHFVDARNGEITYTVVQAIDTAVAGTQNFIVSATDVYGNTTTETIAFLVKDVTDPVLTVAGTQTFTVGATEPNWASYATTDEGTVTVNTSQVDMNTVGTFYVTWVATDAFGNSSTVSLPITIEAAPVEETGGALIYIIISSAVVVVGGGAALFIFRKRIFK